MRTPRPTARAVFAVGEVCAGAFQSLGSRLFLAGGVDPADPFVARQRRDVFPRCASFRRGQKHVPQICGQGMEHTGGGFFLGHEPFYYNSLY